MANKAKSHKSKVQNPPGSSHAKKKSNGSKKTSLAKKNNPGTVAKRKAARKRNPSPGTNLLLFSAVGVVVVKGFDLLLRYVAPTLAAPITIGIMGVAAYGVHAYGRKVLGSWTDVVAGALGIFAFARVWDEYVNQHLPAYLQSGATTGPAQVVAVQPLVDQNTNTQIGVRAHLAGGGYADVIDNGGMQSQYAN